MSNNEVHLFIESWGYEAKNTLKLLHSLPTTKYDFRPTPDWRSLGELAWHLAEVEAFFSDGVASGRFDFGAKLPNLERPRAVEALAPGYERVHAEAVARVRGLTPADMGRKMPFMGHEMQIRDLMWGGLFCHLIHHRGQLALICRMAGGVPPGMYGPNREEMMEMTKAAQK